MNNKLTYLGCLVLWCLPLSKGLADSGVFGNLFVGSNSEFTIHDTEHNFLNNGAGSMPGVMGTERSSPQGFISFTGTATWIGASNTAYIDGYAKTYMTSPFIFPVGDNGVYRPAMISTASTAKPATAAYFSVNPIIAITTSLKGGNEPVLPVGAPFDVLALDTGVAVVSTSGYWDINGSEAANISLTWESDSGIAALTHNNLAKLKMVGWDGSKWTALASVVDPISILGVASSLSTGSITTTTAFIPDTYTAYTLGFINNPPVINSNGAGASANIDINENTTDVALAQATDLDADSISYTLSGSDAALFTINETTGAIRFQSAPDYESPGDGNSDNVYEIIVSASDGSTGVDSQTLNITVTDISETIQLRVQAVLQGAYDANTGLMRDALRSAGYLPLQEPYTALAMIANGTGGGEITTAGVLAITGADAIVDWVLIELRDSSNASVLATRAALLQRDGDVVDTDGISAVNIASQPAGSYLLALKHRNHLGIVTVNPLAISLGVETALDFTAPSTLTQGGNSRVELLAGLSALWAGDANSDDKVIAHGSKNEVNRIMANVWQAVGNVNQQANFILDGYYGTDLDMNGSTIYSGINNDLNLLLENILLNSENLGSNYNFVIDGQLY